MLVYRGLRADEDPEVGLSPRDRNAKASPSDAILPEKLHQNQYICTSKDIRVAAFFAHDTIVAIRVDPSTCVDVSTPEGRQRFLTEKARPYAVRCAEIVIEGSVSKEHIVDTFSLSPSGRELRGRCLQLPALEKMSTFLKGLAVPLHQLSEFKMIDPKKHKVYIDANKNVHFHVDCSCIGMTTRSQWKPVDTERDDLSLCDICIGKGSVAFEDIAYPEESKPPDFYQLSQVPGFGPNKIHKDRNCEKIRGKPASRIRKVSGPVNAADLCQNCRNG